MNAAIDLSGVTLRTARLVLRPFQSGDLEDLFAYASMDGALDMIGRPPHKDRRESLSVLERYIAGRKNFAMVRDDRVIGSFGIEKYDEALFPELDALRCRELSFVLSKAYWGQGLVPEAAQEVIRWLFEEQALDAILCGHFVKNTRSAR
ncbi:MAG: GNAT family N-acetyltransferase, partial [Clostridia bacterium]|nr:GNAT family N-acetyltransferase [Clostridia bacterium]